MMQIRGRGPRASVDLLLAHGVIRGRDIVDHGPSLLHRRALFHPCADAATSDRPLVVDEVVDLARDHLNVCAAHGSARQAVDRVGRHGAERYWRKSIAQL